MEDSWSQYWLSVSRHWVPRVFERKDILVCWVYIINEFDNGIFLVSFDYQTETFRCLCLPNQCRSPYNYVSLSLVKEQKLSVLRRRRRTSQIEVWARNDETEVASWSKLLVVDSPQVLFCHLTSLLVEEENKVLVCCERWMDIQDTTKSNDFVYLVGEDNKITNVDFGASKLLLSCFPLLSSYVPSLVQIQWPIGTRND